MNTSNRGRDLIRGTLRVAAAAAAVAWVGLYCGSISAQAPQPTPKTETEKQNSPQLDPAQARAMEQLAHGIEGLKFDLAQMRERFGTKDARVVQSENELAKLRELQKRFIQITHGDESASAELPRLSEEISAATALKPPEPSPDQLAGLQQELQQMRQQLAEREKQLATLATQMMEQQRRSPLPPLENGTVKVFRLVNAHARDVAKTVESLFGTQARVAVDERSNTLLVYGKPDLLTVLDALLSRLDEQASKNGSEKSVVGAGSLRSLLVRVFWLADNLPETAGQNADDFLPKSVLAATHKLGLEAPRLVTQTVNSLAAGKDDAVDFSTNVPAVLLGRPVGMGCQGKLKVVGDDRIRVDMSVHVGGQLMNCELNGSMATPLGHYMVLGTANSMISEGTAMTGGIPGAPGMAMGPGGMGPEGRLGQPGPGFGRGARGIGAAAPADGGPEGGIVVPGTGPAAGPRGGAGVELTAKQKFETSRFAFVVQVIEGQSYEAEKAKPEGR